MNPVQYDLVEDLAALPCLNESSILHTLQQRYYSNLIHTFAGKKMLLVVHPVHPLSVYTEEVCIQINEIKYIYLQQCIYV